MNTLLWYDNVSRKSRCSASAHKVKRVSVCDCKYGNHELGENAHGNTAWNFVESTDVGCSSRISSMTVRLICFSPPFSSPGKVPSVTVLESPLKN